MNSISPKTLLNKFATCIEMSSGLPPVPTPQEFTHPRAKLNSLPPQTFIHCAIQPTLGAYINSSFPFLFNYIWRWLHINLVSFLKGNNVCFCLSFRVFINSSHLKQSQPQRHPYPDYLWAANCHTNEGGVTGRDLRFTKCFMRAPRSRKSIEFVFQILFLSTCVPGERAGVLLSY